MGEIRELCSAGDETKFTWNNDNDREVRMARENFDRYRTAGFAMFAQEDGGRGRQLTAFDPSVEAIIAVPAMRGG